MQDTQKMKYSPSKHACYHPRIDYPYIPDDVTELTDEEYAIFTGDSVPDGKRLIKNAYPFVLEDIPPMSPRDESKWLLIDEKNIAIKIVNDFNLGLGGVASEDIQDVKLYMQHLEAQAIDDSQEQRARVQRPPIFDRYD